MKIQFAGSSVSKQGAAEGGRCVSAAHGGFCDGQANV